MLSRVGVRGQDVTEHFCKIVKKKNLPPAENPEKRGILQVNNRIELMNRITLPLPLILALILPMSGYAQQPEIVHFQLSGCDRLTSLKIIRQGILTMEYHFDTLHIELSRILNCSQGHNPTVKLSADTLKLNTTLRGYYEIDEKGDTVEWMEEVANCLCCFHLHFFIVGVPDTPVVVLHNESVMQQIPDKLVPFFTINEMHDTVWQHDQEGFVYTNKTLQSGKTVWIEKSYRDQRIIRVYNLKEQLIRETFINYGDGPTLIDWIYHYDETGALLRVEEKIK